MSYNGTELFHKDTPKSFKEN